MEFIQRIEVSFEKQYGPYAAASCLHLQRFLGLDPLPQIGFPWAHALMMSDLKNIAEITLTANTFLILFNGLDEIYQRLETAIKQILSRKEDFERMTQLQLIGYNYSEKAKFSKWTNIEVEFLDYTQPPPEEISSRVNGLFIRVPEPEICWYGDRP